MTGAPQSPLAVRVKEVSRLLSVPRSTIYAWIDRGVLPAAKIGEVTLVLWEDVQELLRNHRLPQRREGRQSRG